MEEAASEEAVAEALEAEMTEAVGEGMTGVAEAGETIPEAQEILSGEISQEAGEGIRVLF